MTATDRPGFTRPPRTVRLALGLIAVVTGLAGLPGAARAADAAIDSLPPADGAPLRPGPLPEPGGPADPAAPADAAAPAAGPTLIFYQGRLTDGAGVPRTGTVSLTVSLYVAAGGGTPLWSETQPTVPLTADGIFNVLLGSLTPFPVNAWSDPDRFLGITVDGGTELTPRLRIAAVPFAIEANRLNGKRSTDFDPAGAADIAAAGVQAQLKGSDASPPNQGSNQVHWFNLYGVPEGFVDGIDDVGQGVLVHGQLEGLDANDHPQYLLGAVAATSDGNPPNVGTNRVHWDNLGGVPAPLVDQQIPSAWILPGTIDSTALGDGQVLARHLAPGAVSGAQVAPGSIGTEQVADASLTGVDIQNSTISGDDIANGTLTGADIQDGSISGVDIGNGSIVGAKVAQGAISEPQLSDGAVSTDKIADGAVSGAKLQDASVGSAQLAPASVGAAQLLPNSVDSTTVADGSLADADLAASPGVGFRNIPGFADTVTSTIGQTIAAVTLDLPGPGWVTVTGGAQAFLLHDSGTLSRLTMSLATAPDQMPDSASVWLTLPASYASELYSLPLQTSMVFPVSAAGPATFYLTVRKGVQPRIPSLHNVRLQAVYLPRRY